MGRGGLFQARDEEVSGDLTTIFYEGCLQFVCRWDDDFQISFIFSGLYD